VARVQAEASRAGFAHLEGICHVYVDRDARLDMAKAIVLNAKMAAPASAAQPRRCCRLRVRATYLKPLVEMLLDAGCEVRGDQVTRIT